MDISRYEHELVKKDNYEITDRALLKHIFALIYKFKVNAYDFGGERIYTFYYGIEEQEEFAFKYDTSKSLIILIDRKIKSKK